MAAARQVYKKQKFIRKNKMDKEKLLEHYKSMVLLRRFDMMCAQLKLKDLIYSGYHPTFGMEAISAGFLTKLRSDDAVLSTHRPHVHAVAKGVPIENVLGEMMAKQCGCSGGLGGAMQFVDHDHKFYCGSIVGSGITIAAGVAMAMKQSGKDDIAVCLFGDGASNTGSFHEGLNLASIWKLPVLFLCENNQYAEAMPAREFVSAERIADRAHGYGLKPWRVDGNDINACAEAADKAIEMLRNGEGPILIEALTYRIKGHYIGDPEQTYRTKEEVKEWMVKEPLIRSKALLKEYKVSDDELTQIDKDVNARLEEAKQYCIDQPYATFEQAVAHVIIEEEKGA